MQRPSNEWRRARLNTGNGQTYSLACWPSESEHIAPPLLWGSEKVKDSSVNMMVMIFLFFFISSQLVPQTLYFHVKPSLTFDYAKPQAGEISTQQMFFMLYLPLLVEHESCFSISQFKVCPKLLAPQQQRDAFAKQRDTQVKQQHAQEEP